MNGDGMPMVTPKVIQISNKSYVNPGNVYDFATMCCVVYAFTISLADSIASITIDGWINIKWLKTDLWSCQNVLQWCYFIAVL